MKKKGVELSQVLGFLSTVTLSSYLTNKDAEGVYFSDTEKLVKGEDKINMCEYYNSIKKSNFVMTHQRISTSGKTKEYAQPFICEDNNFVLMHNGIINEFLGDKGSDTYGYFYNHFLVKFNELKGSREKKTIRAIKETLTECKGSYSIALYDTKKDIMYYFKNKNKCISFNKSDDDKLLYITTKDSNNSYLDFFYREFSEMTIKDEIIYKVTVGRKIKVKRVGRIPQVPEKRMKSYKNRQTQKGDFGDRGNTYDDYMQQQHGSIRENRYWNDMRIGHERRILSVKNEKAVRDIFGERRSLENISSKYSHQFNEIFTSGKRNPTLEDELLCEMLEHGSTLRDMGFSKNFTEEICEKCYRHEGIFLDDRNFRLCQSCIEEIRDTLIDEISDAERHISYMGMDDLEDF